MTKSNKPVQSELREQIEKIIDYAEIFFNDSKWEEREKMQPTYDKLLAMFTDLLQAQQLEHERELVEAYKKGYIAKGIDELQSNQSKGENK